MAVIYIYLFSVLASFISSLMSFRLDFPVHLKVFSCLLGLTLLVELTAFALPYIFHIHHNYWIYDGFILIEFWGYAWFYKQLLPVRWQQRLLLGFQIVFPILWFISILGLFGFTDWNSYGVIMGSFFTVVFALLYYYRILNAPEIVDLRSAPEFWIATGMLIFYMADLPYFGLMNFLITYHREVAANLFYVVESLDIVMYSLFTYGFLCRIRNTKKSL